MLLFHQPFSNKSTNLTKHRSLVFFGSQETVFGDNDYLYVHEYLQCHNDSNLS